MAELSQEEKVGTIKDVIGLVKRLLMRELPDDFNVSIKVRNRIVKRFDVQQVSDEVAVCETQVHVR